MDWWTSWGVGYEIFYANRYFINKFICQWIVCISVTIVSYFRIIPYGKSLNILHLIQSVPSPYLPWGRIGWNWNNIFEYFNSKLPIWNFGKEKQKAKVLIDHSMEKSREEFQGLSETWQVGQWKFLDRSPYSGERIGDLEVWCVLFTCLGSAVSNFHCEIPDTWQMNSNENKIAFPLFIVTTEIMFVCLSR